MNGALTFLLTRTARHRLQRQLRRAAEPRYAVAAALGLVYLGVLLARPPESPAESETFSSLALLAGSVGLAAWTAWAWTLGGASRAATFSGPELAFLLAGPVGDARLLGYKLARAQLPIIANAALWALLLGWSGGGVAAWRALPAAWLLLTTIQLHHLCATVARQRWRPRGGYALEMSAGAAALAAVAWLTAVGWPVIRAAWTGDLAGLPQVAARVLATPQVACLLAPFRAVVAPMTAPTPAAWRESLAPALLALLLHLAVLLLARRSFRRVAAEPSARASAATRRPTSAALVPLRPAGSAALGITWKNVAAAVRRRRAVAFAGASAAAAAAVLAAGSLLDPLVAQVVAVAAGVWLAMLVLIGPQWVRNDLRTDLQYLATVRTWPVPPGRLVAAEVLGSTIVLTLGQLALLGLAGVAAIAAGGELPQAGSAVELALAALALPVVNWLHLVVHNGLAVLLPEWVPLGPQPSTGIEGLGQQAILLVAGMGGLMILLLPGAAAGALVWWTAGAVGSGVATAYAAGGAVGITVAVGTSLWAVGWLGSRLEQLEPAGLEGSRQARGW